MLGKKFFVVCFSSVVFAGIILTHRKDWPQIVEISLETCTRAALLLQLLQYIALYSQSVGARATMGLLLIYSNVTDTTGEEINDVNI